MRGGPKGDDLIPDFRGSPRCEADDCRPICWPVPLAVDRLVALRPGFGAYGNHLTRASNMSRRIGRPLSDPGCNPLIRRLRVESLEDRRMLAGVTVGNSLNVVNGNTASIAALIASPGADGI